MGRGGEYKLHSNDDQLNEIPRSHWMEEQQLFGM